MSRQYLREKWKKRTRVNFTFTTLTLHRERVILTKSSSDMIRIVLEIDSVCSLDFSIYIIWISVVSNPLSTQQNRNVTLYRSLLSCIIQTQTFSRLLQQRMNVELQIVQHSDI